MKKRLFALLMVMVLGITLFAGCSGGSKSTEKGNTDASVSTTPEPTQAPTAEAEEPEATQAPVDDKLAKSEIFVFIAASLSNAMNEINTLYQAKEPNIKINFNADSSGTLQTQIEEGAECDVFFSAATKQMTALDEGGYIEKDSVKNLLENKVVLIKPKGSETKVTGFENIFDARNIALAGEDVPVGAYAREIFTNLGIMDKVAAMEINEGANVTAVLAAVSEASNEVGVVYQTDAASVLDSVDILASAPEGSLKTPVVYPVGLVKNAEADEAQQAAAADFLQFLGTDESLAVFEKYGFSIDAQ